MNQELFKNICLTFLNHPYRWGGDDPMAGFDCSGLVQELLSILSLDPVGDQSAQSLLDYFQTNQNGKKIQITEADIGCVCFYGRDEKTISHVTMCFDNEFVIEAGGGGSKTLTLADAIKQNAYVRIRSIYKRRDLVSIFKPVGLPW